MIEAGCEDIEFDGELISVVSAMEDFGAIQERLRELGLTPLEAGLQRIPNTTKRIDAPTWERIQKLLGALEDDDDVQKVYHNIEYDDSFMD